MLSISELETKGVKKFASKEEFAVYIKKAREESSYYGVSRDMVNAMGVPAQVPMPLATEGGGSQKSAADRVSQTNVQVAGIDEPDIVKTDGKEIYFSPSYYYGGIIMPMRGVEPMMEKMMAPPYYEQSKTKAIHAFPPAELKVDSEIKAAGQLLLHNNTLVVFSGQEIKGYNVENPASPKDKWEMKLENNAWVVQSRLKDGKIYLVASQYVSQSDPCPIRPLSVRGEMVIVPCKDIYYPTAPFGADIAFTAFVVDASSGKVEKNISFVGSSQSSNVYMSNDALYVTHSRNENPIGFAIDFIATEAKDLFPAQLRSRLEKLQGYDISQQAKLAEIQVLLQDHFNSLDKDERLRIENELSNRIGDYYKKNQRKLEKTGIVKIGLETFGIVATGEIPGRPLNQFSLDEYKDYLRIATTVGNNFGWWGWNAWGISGRTGTESVNDVYVLDKDLKVVGLALGLGKGERIYSVRFIEDQGYVVTFRQIDPFYVLDLSNPKNPEVKGELKIPGFSSYLHPMAKDRILGVGQEDWKVKLSLFDVSDPKNPREISKYILDEYWTEVSSNHHAFLKDEKHTVFFLPGGKGGYVFSYKDDKLSLAKAVSQDSVKRALYLNDYLYIIGDAGISVWDETTWTKVKDLKF
ncbi:MAG: beta-propeller domain-containing protein [Candidatus Wildermuthbacteria bacterium]|nr:beta-propeller domain-containing protein [Candidatus Wildermuthbacteria bacterium]